MSRFTSLLHYRLLRIRLGNYVFSPGLFMTLLTIIVAWILFSLGQWQLSRAEYKENLQQTIAQRKYRSPVNLDNIPSSTAEQLYLPVSVTGKYDTRHQFLLDNQVVKGKVGYDVFTPFISANGIRLLVNRGFVAQGKSRDDIPDIHLPDKKITIKGLLDHPPSRGIVLLNNVHNKLSWPMLLQYIDTKEMAAFLDYQLLDMVLQLNKDENSVLEYHLPVLNLNSEKNRGYAFQWFAMTLTVWLLFIFLNTSKMTSQK